MSGPAAALSKKNMLTYIVRRTLLALLTSAVISFLAFVVITLPSGDIVDTLVERLEEEGTIVGYEEARRMREYYGLDKPVLVQYWLWISRIVLHLDFGFSHSVGGQPLIRTVIAERLAFLEGEVDRLAAEVKRLEEEGQFVHQLLEGREERPTLPKVERTD